MDNNKPVLVTGGSGFVGSHTARLLVQRGRRVRVMLRKSSNTEPLNDLPVEIVYGDALDPASLRRAMDGCSTVFHCIVDPRYFLTDTTPLFRTNVQGLVNSMDAAMDCGIERFVFCSSMATLGRNPNGPVTEETPFNWLDKAPPYIRSRVEAERVFLDYCQTRGLPGVALCICNTFGPQDYQPTPQGAMLWEIASGKMRWVWNAGQPTVDIRDAAEAMLLAEQHGRVGERYIIANEYLSHKALFSLAAAEGGRKSVIAVPIPAAYAGSWLVELIMKLLRRKDYLIRTDAVFLSAVFGELDSSKARRELNWQPRPMAETVRDSIAWFRERAKVADVGLSSVFGRW